VPACRARRTTVLGTTTAVEIVVPFDAEDFDTDNIHDVVTNPSRLTCRTAGKYFVAATARWQNVAASGMRRLTIRPNGTATILGESIISPASNTDTEQQVIAIADLAANDYVELFAYQSAGGAVNLDPTTSPLWFSMIRADTLFGALAPAGGSSAPLVTSLPASPVDGQECILCDSLSAPTYQWHLKYVAAKASNKWVFIGGPPKIAVVATAEATSSATFVALATAGPSFTIPVAGDYIITVGSLINPGATVGSIHSYDIGATGAVDANGAQWTGNTSWLGTPMKTNFHQGLAAGTAIVSKYRNQTAAAATYSGRTLTVQPVAVGG